MTRSEIISTLNTRMAQLKIYMPYISGFCKILKLSKPTVCRMTDVTQPETHVQKVLDQIMLNNMAHGNRVFLYAEKMC